MEELRRRVRGLVDQIGVRNPEELTEQLVLLVDGAFSSAQCSARTDRSGILVAAADALIDASADRK